MRAPQVGRQAVRMSLPTMMTPKAPQVKRIAETWETTQAEAIRRMIREKAQQMGLTEGAE
jgi:hypothetical protein